MNNYEEIIVDKIRVNDTIYTYLKNKKYSENYLKNLRKEFGYILLNNQPCFINKKINIGDKIKISKNPYKSSQFQPLDIELEILYEDSEILIVNKPSNLACIPTRSHYNYNLAGAIQNYMLKQDENFVCRIVNRLDKDTSGIVIVAKNSLIANRLQNTKIDKTYYALVDGIFTKYMVIDKPISTITDNNGIKLNKRVTNLPNGKKAITYITPIKQFENYTLIKVKLEYGRTHQIRCHLSSIGHSLLGDTVYGVSSDKINHTALICKELSFLHPVTNKQIFITIDYPQDFKDLIS